MIQRFSIAAVAAMALFAPLPSRASDIIFPGGGSLAQVVDGGGSYSIITLVNLDSVNIPYTLYFFSDTGTPLSFTTTAGANSVLSGTIAVGGSVIIQTNGNGSGIAQGYAVVASQSPSCYGFGTGDGLCQIGGSVVFGLPLGNAVHEATVSLDTGIDSVMAIPFDSTTANVGVAIANSVGDATYQPQGKGETANLAFSFYDQSGNNFYSTSMQLASGAHQAFVLANQFPQVQGRTGMMVVSATDSSGYAYAIKTIGFRANLAGSTYTSVPPLVPCNYNPSYGCTN